MTTVQQPRCVGCGTLVPAASGRRLISSPSSVHLLPTLKELMEEKVKAVELSLVELLLVLYVENVLEHLNRSKSKNQCSSKTWKMQLSIWPLVQEVHLQFWVSIQVLKNWKHWNTFNQQRDHVSEIHRSLLLLLDGGNEHTKW